MLGHSLLGTTQRYLRPTSEFLAEQLSEFTIGKLEKLLGEDFND